MFRVRKVLVVGSSHYMEVLLKIALENLPFHVKFRAHGEEALSALVTGEYECLIITSSPAAMTAEEFIARVRSFPGGQSVPILCFQRALGPEFVDGEWRIHRIDEDSLHSAPLLAAVESAILHSRESLQNNSSQHSLENLSKEELIRLVEKTAQLLSVSENNLDLLSRSHSILYGREYRPSPEVAGLRAPERHSYHVSLPEREEQSVDEPLAAPLKQKEQVLEKSAPPPVTKVAAPPEKNEKAAPPDKKQLPKEVKEVEAKINQYHESHEEIPELLQLMPELQPMVKDFLDSLLSELSRIEEAFTSGELQQCKSALFDLSGNSGLFGFPKFSERLTSLAEDVSSSSKNSFEERFEGIKAMAVRLVNSGETLCSEFSEENEGKREADSSPNGEEGNVRTLSDLNPDEKQFLQDYLENFETEFGRVLDAHKKEDWNKVAFVSNELAGTAALSGLRSLCEALLRIEEHAIDHDVMRIAESISFAEMHGRELLIHFRAQLGDATEGGGEEEITEAPLEEPKTEAKTEPKAETKIITSELVESSPDLYPLIQEFVGGLDGMFGRLKEAHDEGDWKKTSAVAHEIAGAAGMYGYPECHRVCKSVQKGAENQEESDVLSGMRELEQMVLEMKAGV